MSELTLLVVLKVAYLGCGLILCLVGKGLIEKKLEANFEGEGSVGKSSFKVVTASPGLIFLVAGLLAIGAAIFQGFEIVDSSKESFTESTDQSTEKITKLVGKIREIRFINTDLSGPSVNAAINLATEYAVAGNIEESAVYVAIAIVTSPGTLARFHEDKVFVAVLKNPHLNNIIQSRFALPISMPQTPDNQLSTVAVQNLAQLQSLARLESLAADQISLASKKSESIPNIDNQQSEEQTLKILEQILDLSADALLKELSKPHRRWVLENEKIMIKLELAIDLKVRNG